MADIISTKVITGRVRLSYCHVFEPQIGEDGKAKYSTAIIIPKKDTKTLDAIQKAVEQAKKAGASKWGGKIPPRLKEPLRDGDLERPDDEAYRDSYFMNCSCNTRPGIIDINRRPIIDSTEIYSGCYAFASITFYAFDVSGNRGIACGLNNLMKCADGEPLGGRAKAEDDFAGIGNDEDFEDDLLD